MITPREIPRVDVQWFAHGNKDAIKGVPIIDNNNRAYSKNNTTSVIHILTKVLALVLVVMEEMTNCFKSHMQFNNIINYHLSSW